MHSLNVGVSPSERYWNDCEVSHKSILRDSAGVEKVDLLERVTSQDEQREEVVVGVDVDPFFFSVLRVASNGLLSKK